MSVRVKYFASLREYIGRGEDVVSGGDVTVATIWDRAAGGRRLPPNTLVAVNMEYSRLDDIVREGDEVAFFPPVTGG